MQQSHTFASRTSRHTSLSLQKSVPVSTQTEIQDIPPPSKKNKIPETQTNRTKTVKLSNDNGLQTQSTERQLVTACFLIWR